MQKYSFVIKPVTTKHSQGQTIWSVNAGLYGETADMKAFEKEVSPLFDVDEKWREPSRDAFPQKLDLLLKLSKHLKDNKIKLVFTYTDTAHRRESFRAEHPVALGQYEAVARFMQNVQNLDENYTLRFTTNGSFSKNADGFHKQNMTKSSRDILAELLQPNSIKFSTSASSPAIRTADLLAGLFSWYGNGQFSHYKKDQYNAENFEDKSFSVSRYRNGLCRVFLRQLRKNSGLELHPDKPMQSIRNIRDLLGKTQTGSWEEIPLAEVVEVMPGPGSNS